MELAEPEYASTAINVVIKQVRKVLSDKDLRSKYNLNRHPVLWIFLFVFKYVFHLLVVVGSAI